MLYTGEDPVPLTRASCCCWILSTRTTKRLRSGTAGRYLPNDMVFVVGGTLWVMTFDVDCLETRGATVPVIKGVRVDSESGAVQVAVTDTGALEISLATSSFQRTLVWVDWQGRKPLLVCHRALMPTLGCRPTAPGLPVTTKDGGQDAHVGMRRAGC